jgi:hypothetical protein
VGSNTNRSHLTPHFVRLSYSYIFVCQSCVAEGASLAGLGRSRTMGSFSDSDIATVAVGACLVFVALMFFMWSFNKYREYVHIKRLSEGDEVPSPPFPSLPHTSSCILCAWSTTSLANACIVTCCCCCCCCCGGGGGGCCWWLRLWARQAHLLLLPFVRSHFFLPCANFPISHADPPAGWHVAASPLTDSRRFRLSYTRARR